MMFAVVFSHGTEKQPDLTISNGRPPSKSGPPQAGLNHLLPNHLGPATAKSAENVKKNIEITNVWSKFKRQSLGFRVAKPKVWKTRKSICDIGVGCR